MIGENEDDKSMNCFYMYKSKLVYSSKQLYVRQSIGQKVYPGAIILAISEKKIAMEKVVQ